MDSPRHPTPGSPFTQHPAEMTVDVVIVGAGPAGLSAALALGRARRSVLLLDAGPRRNAAAEQVHNFVTRDGTPPNEFRRVAREQLEPYPSVAVHDDAVVAIHGERGAFDVELATRQVRARRILLCTGMVDMLPEIEGFRELWGTSIVICPYCHGWEVQDTRFGYLASSVESVPFAVFLRGWSGHVVMLTDGKFSLSLAVRAQLDASGVRWDERPLARFVGEGGVLRAVAFDEGEDLPLDVLFAHPPQRQVQLVEHLGLECSETGHLQVDPVTCQSSTPGIYAAGDLTTAVQSALTAAHSGMHAASMVSHDLIMERASVRHP